MTTEYYIMRHADYFDKDNEYISYYGMLTLRTRMDNLKAELTDKHPQKKLRIIHSILPRAKHTALLMREMLSGIDVYLRRDPRLNSDKLQINKKYISEVISSCSKDSEICLILSHQPDIEFFSKQKLDNSEYKCLSVELEEEPASTKSDDDLPF
jgi:hypothetical protein